MAQLLIRNLNSATVNCLKDMARTHHRSLQGEVQHILEQATAGTELTRKWPADFCEQVLGGWQGEPLTRHAQGEYEKREEFE
jgi:hypothetical protein